MIFSLGNLLTIAIVIIILIIYRQLDVNNRSLEKMKKYFNKIKEELDAIVEEKAMGLKDLSIELDVHEKTVKEVYNRIEQSAGDLVAREQELLLIHKRIDSYDAVLKELSDMTARVDENLKKLHEESIFIDNVNKRLKESSSAMEKIENKIPAIVDEFSKKNEESAEILKVGIFNEIELKSNTIKEQLEESKREIHDFSEYLSKLEKRRDALGEQTIKEIRQELDHMSEEFSSNLYKTEEEFEKRLFDVGQRGAVLGEEVFKTLRKDIEDKTSGINSDVEGNLKSLETRIKEQFEKVSLGMKEFEKNIKDKYVDTQKNSIQHYESVISNIKEFEKGLDGESGKIEKMRKEIESISRDFDKNLDSYRIFIAELEQKKSSESAKFSKKLDEDVNNFTQKFQNKVEKLEEKYNLKFAKSEEENNNHQNVLFNELRKQVTQNVEYVKKELFKQIETVDSQAISSLSQVEENIKEYESSINYKMEGLIGFEKDIDAMEKNLKTMINKVSEKMKDDFHSFEISIDAEKSAQKVKLDNDFKEIREVLETLESRIDELKKKSYENVAEKLQVFEDEFFNDLKVRNDSINSKLESWQKEVNERIDKVSLETVGIREEIENKYLEAMKERLNEIQVKTNAQHQKYENAVSIFKNDIDEKLILIEKTVKDFEVSLKAETEDIKVAGYNYFNKEFTEYHTSIDEKLRQYEKDIEKKIIKLDDLIESNKKELFADLDNAKADMQAWYSGFDQDMKSNQESLSQQNLRLREDVAKIIEHLKGEYSEEKETLVNESKATREFYKKQLEEIALNIGKLNDDLKEKSQAVIEKLKTDSENFMNDFTKKTRDLELEIDNKTKEFKTGAQDIKVRIENTEKKIMAKIAENAKALNVTLDDIDKKQKNFANQTKIFERADSLKTALDEKIEELKSDIIKVDAQSKDIKVAEKKFDNIRKLGDEVSTKLNRFLAEKRKIDEIEGDFKKLLNMSQAVDVKLEHVTNVYDSLQEIDIKLRNFESLFKDITEKFQRLEKKENIIETTTDGVDKNFQILQQLEKGFKELSETADMLPMRLNEVETRFKKINIEKGEADKIIGKLDSMSDIMSDIEERMDKLQKAREWLARTETRLNESVKKAEDNVALLGTLLDKDSKGKKPQKSGAPSMDKREMVVKLAHQGWTSDNIAQATGLSRGEVELILEIMPKK